MTFYIEDAMARGFTPATVRSYQSSLERYLAFLATLDVDPKRVGTPELKLLLAEFQRHRLQPDTILNNFSAISSFYDHLVAEGKAPGNPVPAFRKRYLRMIARDRENKRSHPRRQVPDQESLRRLVECGLGARDQALLTLLLKTGLRREEAELLDVQDVDLKAMEVHVHPHRKRANTRVFFDEECRLLLHRWLEQRPHRAEPGEISLFVGPSGRRLGRSGIYTAVVDAATRAKIHDPKSRRPEDRFTPHHCRHFFTSILLNRGVPRQFVQWLRGDHAKEAVDQYFHVDVEEVRRRYLAAMPRLGV